MLSYTTQGQITRSSSENNHIQPALMSHQWSGGHSLDPLTILACRCCQDNPDDTTFYLTTMSTGNGENDHKYLQVDGAISREQGSDTARMQDRITSIQSGGGAEVESGPGTLEIKWKASRTEMQRIEWKDARTAIGHKFALRGTRSENRVYLYKIVLGS